MSTDDGRRLAALQFHDFRLMWGGNFVSVVGTQMQFVAINWHVYQLLAGTSLTVDLFGRDVALGAEALGLGGVGLARVIPIMFFALVGGTLADMANRRKLLIVTNGIAAAAGRCAGRAQLCPARHGLDIYLLTAAGAATAAFSCPRFSRSSPTWCRASDLTNAISLNSIVRHIATIIGPALAGSDHRRGHESAGSTPSTPSPSLPSLSRWRCSTTRPGRASPTRAGWAGARLSRAGALCAARASSGAA